MSYPKRPRKEAGIEEYWSDVRKGAKRAKSSEVFLMPSIAPLIAWAQADETERAPLLVVPGPSYQDRLTVLQQWEAGDWKRFHPTILTDSFSAFTRSWLADGIPKNLDDRVARLTIPHEAKDLLHDGFPPTPGIWEILWALITTEDFLVEEPLRSMVDQSFYLVHDVFKALWEARFLVREHEGAEPVQGFVDTLTRWLTASALQPRDVERLSAVAIKRTIASEQEHFDVLCFLLTLAAHNGILERVIFTFDGLEDGLGPEHRGTLRQLHTLLQTIERWVNIGGCPLSIIVGFRASKSDLSALKKFHPKLAADITRGLSWVKTC